MLRQDGDSHDVSGNAAGSAQVGLLPDIHVRDVFILAEERQMQDDLKGLGVSCQDYEIGYTPVQSLGGLVGAFLKELESLGLIE